MDEMVSKAKRFFRSYGVKCDEKLVEEWLTHNSSSNGLSNNFTKKILMISMNGVDGKTQHMKKE